MASERPGAIQGKILGFSGVSFGGNGSDSALPVNVAPASRRPDRRAGSPAAETPRRSGRRLREPGELPMRQLLAILYCFAVIELVCRGRGPEVMRRVLPLSILKTRQLPRPKLWRRAGLLRRRGPPGFPGMVYKRSGFLPRPRRHQPSKDSDIKIEVWMPAAGWNGKFQATGQRRFRGID